MKTTIKLLLGALVAGTALSACQKEEFYQSSITRVSDIEITKDGEPFNVHYGTDDAGHLINRVIQFYHKDGTFFTNFGTNYNIDLPDDEYKVVVVTDTVLHRWKNMNDDVIAQNPTGNKTYAISTPMTWHPGEPLKINAITRYGTLRLKAMDTAPDRSYAKVRATYKSPVIGWNVGKAKPVCADNEEDYTVLSYETDLTGGVGYTQECKLIETESIGKTVEVTIEYLDAAGNVLKTKEFEAGIPLKPTDVTVAEFYLNNTDEPDKISFNIDIETEWTNSTVYPAVKVEIPDGYGFVDGETTTLDQAFSEQLKDETVTEIKLFLKANRNYTLSKANAENITKPVTILGQTPGYGQKAAAVAVEPIAFSGNLSQLHFENLALSMKSGARFFNLPSTKTFKVDEIAIVNCSLDGFTGSFYYDAATKADSHIVGHMLLDKVKFTNMKSNANSLFYIKDSKELPMHKWTMKNCVFQGAMTAGHTVIIKGLKQQTALDFTVDNCVFLSSTAADYTWFDLDASAATGAKLTVNNCLIGGAGAGGTWFKLTNVNDVTATGNTRTAGFTMTTWGVTEPTEVATTYDEAVNANK